ncbi:hypothetical protein L7F22_019309 [Adiantum nelumboides]|nr:hypothetical protein [Adiantum nelumboides]
MLLKMSNEKGEPVRQGGRAEKGVASYAGIGKGKGIAHSPPLAHSGSSPDSAHLDRHTKEQLYAHQNSQSLPLELGKSRIKERLGNYSLHSPAHSEGYLGGGSSSRSGGGSGGKSSVGSVGSKAAAKLSPIGKDIERRIKNTKNPDAIRQILIKGTGFHSSDRVNENQEKIQRIDQKLLEKNRPAALSKINKHVPTTYEWEKAKAERSHKKHFGRMQDVVHDVTVHADRGNLNLNVLTEISELADAEKQHRAMLRHERMQNSSLPPRHPQPSASISRNTSTRHSPTSSQPHSLPHTSSQGSDRSESPGRT